MLKQKICSLLDRYLDRYLDRDITKAYIVKTIDNYMNGDRAKLTLDRNLDTYLQRDFTRAYIEKSIDSYLDRDLSINAISHHFEKNEALTKTLWKATNVRPDGIDYFYSSIPNSIRESRMMNATLDTGDFVTEHIPHLEGNKNAFITLENALDAVTINGLYLEFGVFSGTTINHISSLKPKEKVHGFDSFEGLPERWGAAQKGTFHTHGYLPEVNDNVTLHKGWFDDTLPAFLKKEKAPVAFLHCDADLYSSTKTILDNLKGQIIPGTIIVFDEYFNYPFWREHEYKAFNEFIESTGYGFEYIAFTDRGFSAAVKIKEQA